MRARPKRVIEGMHHARHQQNDIVGEWVTGVSEIANSNPPDLRNLTRIFARATPDQLGATLGQTQRYRGASSRPRQSHAQGPGDAMLAWTTQNCARQGPAMTSATQTIPRPKRQPAAGNRRTAQPRKQGTYNVY